MGQKQGRDYPLSPTPKYTQSQKDSANKETRRVAASTFIAGAVRDEKKKQDYLRKSDSLSNEAGKLRKKAADDVIKARSRSVSSPDGEYSSSKEGKLQKTYNVSNAMKQSEKLDAEAQDYKKAASVAGKRVSEQLKYSRIVRTPKKK